MDENELRAFLGFIFKGKFEDIALVEDEFIYACSAVSKCEKHGYHLEQNAEKLASDNIC